MAALLAGGIPTAAQAYSSDTPPNLVPYLTGFNQFWQSNGNSDLHGTVLDAKTLERNDELTVWINNHATPAQQFRAMQDSEYNFTGTAYDESVTLSTALGSVLGPLYVQGLENGDLPLTQALISSETGTTGAYVSTGTAKATFSYPRPFLPSDPSTPPVPGDSASCSPTTINGSSLKALRVGRSYADANGNLKIVRVPDTVDATDEFSPNTVSLSASYGSAGICTGGAFPSGHTTTAYEAGITLATLLPQLAPEILARSSEQGNDRIVLGVHYPLDIMGGRLDGEVALATRWSDAPFVTAVLEPAQQELVDYLQTACGATIIDCYDSGTPYQDNPYGGLKMPGGTAQIVTDRASALSVYTQRLTYGFDPTGQTGLAASVPAGAENLLDTAYPTLTDAQRISVLAQTEIASGYPLDQTASGNGSWERLNLAAAMSATVRVASDGTVTVARTGGLPRVKMIKTAQLQLATTTASAGDTITVTGSGFAAGATVQLDLQGRDPATLGTATADANGLISTAVTIPAATRHGGYAITAVDPDTSAALTPAVRLHVIPGQAS